ncbi:MAG TPA: FecR family protein [Bacteroidales bacterium]
MENFYQIPEEIQLLISDFFNKSIDEEGLYRLNQWVAESDEHVHLFNSFKSVWMLSGKSVHMRPEKTEIALHSVKQRLEVGHLKGINIFRSMQRIAASWLIFLMIGGASGFFITKHALSHRQKQLYTSISSPLGSKSTIELPDGTKVWLNAGSKIVYNNEYGHSVREVQLTGEAYFSVKTNKKVPFLVRTSDVVVKALGTKFNVKAYPEEKTITATLEEGKIVITPLGNLSSKKVVELKPNEMATFYKQREKINTFQKKIAPQIHNQEPEKSGTLNVNSNVNTNLVTSWKDSTWIIEAQPLGILAPVLERRYNMVIEFGSDRIKKYKFTGKIQKETIEQIMSALELSAPIQYKIARDTVILSLNKTRQKQYEQYTND